MTNSAAPVMNNDVDSTRSDLRLKLAIEAIANKSYLGSILQCLRIYRDSRNCPTMGVFYDKKLRTISMMYNPEFVDKLSNPELIAVLYHEMEHIMRNHIFIYNKEQFRKDHKRFNIAMDLVINQTIPNLPKQAMFIENFKDKKGKPFPKGQSTETYYDLLDDATHNNPNAGEGEKEMQTLDQHFWEGVDEKEALEGTAELLKRAQNQYEKSHSTKCKEISDVLGELIKSLTDIDFKRILASSLRKSMPGKDITKTWTRPSRRYGMIARGNKIKPNPSIALYMDTSGSISYTEVNECINIVTDIFKHGVKKITLNLFHHNLYLKDKIWKKGEEFKREDLQSGGTDLTQAMNHLQIQDADINIILTDGYYDRPAMKKKVTKTTFFLIKEGGCLDHKLKDIGKTLSYKVVK